MLCVFVYLSEIKCHTMGVLLVFGILLTFLNSNDALYINNELPCHFQDSINITNGQLQADGARIHDGTIYSKEQYALVNYRITDGKARVPVKSHLRGCPCNVKPCISLCCPLGSFVSTRNLKKGTILQEIPCYNHAAAQNYEYDVVDLNNQTNRQKLNELFSFVVLQSPVKFYKTKKFQITIVNRYIFGHIKSLYFWRHSL